MKLGEEFIDGDDSTFHIKRTFDIEPTLERAKILRNNDMGKFGESRAIGTIPGWLVHEWMNEAGVAHNDQNARDEIIRKKMLSGEFDKLRIWKGTF